MGGRVRSSEEGEEHEADGEEEEGDLATVGERMTDGKGEEYLQRQFDNGQRLSKASLLRIVCQRELLMDNMAYPDHAWNTELTAPCTLVDGADHDRKLIDSIWSRVGCLPTSWKEKGIVWAIWSKRFAKEAGNPLDSDGGCAPYLDYVRVCELDECKSRGNIHSGLLPWIDILMLGSGRITGKNLTALESFPTLIFLCSLTVGCGPELLRHPRDLVSVTSAAALLDLSLLY